MASIVIFVKEKIDVVGGSILGFITGSLKTGLFHYTEHILTEEVMFKFIDACITTTVTTILGAVCLHLYRKYLCKK